MKKALVILFDKVEELEAVAPIDILRRAGVDVTTASLHEELQVVGRSGIAMDCDEIFDEVRGAFYDAIILPGGPGTSEHLGFEPLLKALKDQHDAGRLVAAICAAPLLLEEAGILEGRKCTAHTSVIGKLKNCDSSALVVTDGNVITSRGAGTAVEFALAVLEQLEGPESAAEVAASICFGG